LPPRNDPLYTVSTFLGTFAAKKGWYTASNLPNEFQAAKKVLKDYTTGKLCFCMMRPDFDPSVHTKVLQAGFTLDLEEKAVPQANNYEEMKEANSDEEDDSDDEKTTITTVEATSVSESQISTV
jgi:hypothetical protein